MIRHTTRLLTRHNCVILPGIGAFLAHKVPASYNAKEQVFMPPHRTLCFNPQVTVDDALLLSEYAAAGNTSYENAEKAFKRDIASLRRKLASDGRCCFGEAGTFHMNINGEISFVASENAIDDPANYGFEPLTMPLLSQCKEKAIVIGRREFSRYIAIAAAVILAFFFVTPVSDSAYEQGMQASIAQMTKKEAASAPVATEVEQYSIAPIEDTVTENIYTEPVQQQNAAVEIPSIEEPATAVAEVAEETSVPAEVTEPQKTFSVIVASSPNAQNAELAIKELSRKMDAEYSVVVGGGRHRISIGDYDSIEDANDAAFAIKSTFPDAWVLTH